MSQSLDLGADPKHRKRQRERSRDSRKGNGKSANLKSSLQHMEISVTDSAAERRQVRMPAYLSKTKSEITEAFNDLESKQRSRISGALSDTNPLFKLNRSIDVLARNRYGNIQPWDNSRIRLQHPIGGSDYVNASPIKLHSLSQRARKRLRRTSSTNSNPSLSFGQDYSYIATQGPKEGQFSHFWHMVMQESVGDVGVIVMLTRCYEGNKEKCAQYFPTEKHNPILLDSENRGTKNVTAITSDDETLPSKTMNIEAQSDGVRENSDMTDAGQVELISSSYDAGVGCVIRTLHLSIGTHKKTIIHYLYEHWPDFGKPEAEERAALLRLMRMSRESAGESPRIVHCSAGVGRTGTFVALDFLIAELEAGRLAICDIDSSKNEIGGEDGILSDSQDTQKSAETYGKSGIARHKITTPELKQGDTSTTETMAGDLIHDTVDALRQQRMMMVMNEIQYGLLYEVVREVFIDVYAAKATGAVIIASEQDDKIATERTAEATRINSDLNMTSSSPRQSPHGSEADTEIAEAMSPRTEASWDPYAEVAPEGIRQNLGLENQHS